MVITPEVSRTPRGITGGDRHHGRLALAVLLVAGGGLVFLQLYRGRGQRQEVVVVKRDVAAGTAITSADVGIVSVATESELEVIPRAEFAVLKGRVAQVHLSAGAPLQRGQLAAGAPLSDGQAVVAVSVPVATLPAGLRADASVEVYADGEAVAAKVVEVRKTDSGAANTGVSLRIDRASAKAVVVAKEIRLVVVAS